MTQVCNRKVFLRGQSHFSWFFSRREMLFSRKKISILVDPKQILVILKSDKKKKKKKKKKKVLSSQMPIFNFPLSLYFDNFPSFPLNFHPLSLFNTLAAFFRVGQQKFPGQKSRGGGSLPSLRLLRHWYDPRALSHRRVCFLTPAKVYYVGLTTSIIFRASISSF